MGENINPNSFIFTALIMEDQVLVSGSIVLYKNNLDVLKVIQSFLQTSSSVKLFLIDNSPTDSVRNTLQDWLHNERVSYIFNNKNIGYGAAHNIAIAKSLAEGYPFHFIFNPDIEFTQDVITEISNYMKHNPDIGLIMPKILYENGDIQYLCKLLPTPFDLFIRRFLPDKLTRSRTNKFELRETGYNKIMEVPFLSGCFMALRREAIEQCGMFDERFFMYGEDIDFSRRIHEKFKTVYYPAATIVHGYEAASYKNVKMLLIHSVNIIRYFNKWGWFFDKKRKQINADTVKALHM